MVAFTAFDYELKKKKNLYVSLDIIDLVCLTQGDNIGDISE